MSTRPIHLNSESILVIELSSPSSSVSSPAKQEQVQAASLQTNLKNALKEKTELELARKKIDTQNKLLDAMRLASKESEQQAKAKEEKYQLAWEQANEQIKTLKANALKQNEQSQKIEKSLEELRKKTDTKIAELGKSLAFEQERTVTLAAKNKAQLDAKEEVVQSSLKLEKSLHSAQFAKQEVESQYVELKKTYEQSLEEMEQLRETLKQSQDANKELLKTNSQIEAAANLESQRLKTLNQRLSSKLMKSQAELRTGQINNEALFQENTSLFNQVRSLEIYKQGASQHLFNLRGQLDFERGVSAALRVELERTKRLFMTPPVFYYPVQVDNGQPAMQQASEQQMAKQLESLSAELDNLKMQAEEKASIEPEATKSDTPIYLDRKKRRKNEELLSSDFNSAPTRGRLSVSI